MLATNIAKYLKIENTISILKHIQHIGFANFAKQTILLTNHPINLIIHKTTQRNHLNLSINEVIGDATAFNGVITAFFKLPNGDVIIFFTSKNPSV